MALYRSAPSWLSARDHAEPTGEISLPRLTQFPRVTDAAEPAAFKQAKKYLPSRTRLIQVRAGLLVMLHALGRWNKTERVDDALGSDKTAPFITNFHMVDTNSDHKVSFEEFKAGCKNGWIEEGSDSRLPTKQISPDVPKE